MWEIRYNGFNNEHEFAASIVLDHEENVILSGMSMGLSGYRLCGWKYSNPLDIEELNVNALNMLSMYPNPAQQYLNIHIGEPAVPELLVRIFNIRGEKVSEHISLCDDGFMQVDVSALRPGTYFLQAATGKMQYSAKFLKD
ncbi:MAG: T9SS type A sorting domain-containing protein [Bacteroidales bacterium]|nr:T9SS type A sorting domain-containing protein [Bacteroidales bacterium]